MYRFYISVTTMSCQYRWRLKVQYRWRLAVLYPRLMP